MHTAKGYIAIVTAILISFLMLLLAVTFGASSLLGRFEAVDYSSKRTSYFVARSCLDHARLELALDSSYAGDENVAVDTHQCTVRPLTTQGSNTIIEATAIINGQTTNLSLTVLTAELTTVSFAEVADF